MFKSPVFAAIGAALALAALPASPVLAQEMGGSNSASQAQSQQNTQAQDAINAQNDRNQERQGGRQGRRNANRNAAPAAPTPEQLIAEAQVIATAAAPGCQVTSATMLGVTAEQAKTYEAACAAGPGYVLIGTTPPRAVDCVVLAGQARVTRMGDPAADVGTQCVIPQNTDVLRVMVEYGRAANLPCVPNEGAALAKQLGGDELYEVGCDGVDGYILQKLAAGGWTTTECSRVVDAQLACAFTTTAEKAASLKARLAPNAEAAACDVSEGRYMGANANGSFYEAKCAAGDGIIVRFNPAFEVQQVYPCETAHRIGGGCTLTIVPPEAVPAPAEGAAPAQQ